MRRKEPRDGDLAGQPLSKEQGRICRKAADYRGARMGPQAAQHTTSNATSIVVLDSNVVLGLFWFQDPALDLLQRALEDRTLTWHACAPMREELMEVMSRDGLRTPSQTGRPVGRGHAARQVLTAFDSLVCSTPSMPNLSNPRCTDADDQVFIDLAVGLKARWLFSRDAAVLKLRRRLHALSGCDVMRPEAWRP